MAIWQDIRYAIRKLVRRPAFTAVVLATLALGVGANTAIFGMVNQILLRPLPGAERPETLVRVYTSDYSSGPYGSSSLPDYEDYRAQARAFRDLAAFAEWPSATLGLADGAERVDVAIVTGNFFPLVGIDMAAGRSLLPSDDRERGGHPVAVISHGLWRQRFGGDRGVVGRRITLDGSDFEVVGVVAEAFTGMFQGSTPDVWVPLSMLTAISLPARWFESRGSRWADMVGRLAPGATIEEATDQVRTIARRLADTYPDTNLGTLQDPDAPRPMTLVPASEARVGAGNRETMVRAAWLLMGVVVLVLLIACSNLANLLLARARSREQEIAVRLSVGASRVQVTRQLLTESLLLGGVGGGAGLAVAAWLNDLLLRATQQRVVDNLGLASLELDPRVLGFTAAVALTSGVLFGLVPALTARKTELVPALKGAGSRPVRRGRRVTSKDWLVVSQVAMALVLLVGTGLMVRSLRSTLAVDPGFDLDRALIADMALSDRYDDETGPAFLDELERNVEAMPAVRNASFAMVVPVTPGGSRRSASIPGYEPAEGESMEINFNVVGVDYLETMGIDLLAGRSFQPSDNADAAPVAIVNRAFADRYFRGADPVGRHFRWGGPCSGDCDPDSPDQGGIRIVGMAENGKYRSLREEPTPYVYQPIAQAYIRFPSLIVASDAEPASIATPVRNTLTALDPSIPFFNVRTMDRHLGNLVAAESAITTLVGGFGILALLLSALGIYGVMSFVVADRTREIGLRTALGAHATATLALFLRRGLLLTAAGTILGLILAAGASQLVGSFLFEIDPLDPGVYLATAGVLGLAATAATVVPAARAARVDPMVALRSE